MLQVTLKGHPVKVGGDRIVKVGNEAPEVVVVTKDLAEKTVGGARGKVQVLIAVPSLDTEVCALETKRFNEKLAAFGDPVEGTVISMDLPFAAKRFCTAEGIENVEVASDFRDRAFGRNYGVIILEGPLQGLLARVVFVVDPAGRVAYKQVVPEITQEPNYEDVLAAVRKLLP